MAKKDEVKDFSLEEMAWEYFDLDQQIKGLTEKKDKLNAEIKNKMRDLELDKCTVGIYNISVSTQSRKKLNEDRLLDRLRLFNVPGTIKTIEVADLEAVEDAIYEGKLSAETLNECVEINPVYVLKVTKKKNSNSKGGKK